MCIVFFMTDHNKDIMSSGETYERIYNLLLESCYSKYRRLKYLYTGIGTRELSGVVRSFAFYVAMVLIVRLLSILLGNIESHSA